MTIQPITANHDHIFLGRDHNRNETKVWLVIALTASMMVVEIIAGTIFGSMALVADGWHMSTHAGAMLVTALSYYYARRFVKDRRFTFGTGKFGDLAGFASAIILALVAVIICFESLLRLFNPIEISFGQAILVAVVGLIVNLVSAYLLKDDHHHHLGHSHQHSHAHEHDHGHSHDHVHNDDYHQSKNAKDNNLRAAYLHVLADALTSVLAIIALIFGWIYGWLWADPLMGVVGAIVIGRWSWGLIRDTGGVLVDADPENSQLTTEIITALKNENATITDLHIWQLGPGHHGAIIALNSEVPQTPDYYKGRLHGIHELSHITIEVNNHSENLLLAKYVTKTQ
ncbi:CDF family Co(II)/Ni(II) efflux transporter DmeF [Bartonella sp. HY406]|uniref:CDF family Co(II)/Ni(II) efflux transporter DmeF n=1 Tax=Bartonella sp. HY406 TaxID=2979331 RepID=UPI0021C60A64|nr:CDF family Co(II)/Ni(II) efflux transporter DmeF [Bartonella sp. HY406]UXN02483.1 CDF family Co(II)/Ni(II) efflux transporter DmeF [Bartonella sp. HY406]